MSDREWGNSTDAFERGDGVSLLVVPGFRDRMLSYRASVTPKDGWTVSEYDAAAATKRRRFRRLLAECQQRMSVKGMRILDVGCGDGANTVLFALEPIEVAIGIDLTLPLRSNDTKGQRTRALTSSILQGGDLPHSARFMIMDATRMQFDDSTFDLTISRSAMEHIKPVEDALSEIARVTRPGGLIYLAIDPFYWVRGCHKSGVVDIPFAHARLTLDEYTKFVEAREGRNVASRRRQRLETLNQFTAQQWRSKIDAMPCKVLASNNKDSEIGRVVLEEFPEIPASLLPQVSMVDLLSERIEVWLRRE